MDVGPLGALQYEPNLETLAVNLAAVVYRELSSQ
jgi:hypothetical protein